MVQLEASYFHRMMYGTMAKVLAVLQAPRVRQNPVPMLPSNEHLPLVLCFLVNQPDLLLNTHSLTSMTSHRIVVRVGWYCCSLSPLFLFRVRAVTCDLIEHVCPL